MKKTFLILQWQESCNLSDYHHPEELSKAALQIIKQFYPHSLNVDTTLTTWMILLLAANNSFTTHFAYID